VTRAGEKKSGEMIWRCAVNRGREGDRIAESLEKKSCVLILLGDSTICRGGNTKKEERKQKGEKKIWLVFQLPLKTERLGKVSSQLFFQKGKRRRAATGCTQHINVTGYPREKGTGAFRRKVKRTYRDRRQTFTGQRGKPKKIIHGFARLSRKSGEIREQTHFELNGR